MENEIIEHILIGHDPSCGNGYALITIDLSHYPGVEANDALWMLKHPDSRARPAWVYPEKEWRQPTFEDGRFIRLFTLEAHRFSDEQIRDDIHYALRHAPVTEKEVATTASEIKQLLVFLTDQPYGLQSNFTLDATLTIGTGTLNRPMELTVTTKRIPRLQPRR
jgi:hypothetical protein